MPAPPPDPLGRWIPAAVSSDVDGNRRARILIVVSIVTGLLALVAGLVRDALVPMPPLAFWAVVAAALLFIASPIVLRLTGKLAVAGAFHPIVLVVVPSIVAYEQGGLSVPVLAVLPLAPLVATFFSGPRAAVLFGAAAVATIGLFAWLDATGHVYPAHPPSEEIDRTRGVALVFAVVATALFAWMYERQRQAVEVQLKASEQRYALAAAAANDGLFDWNLDSDVVVRSRQFDKLTDRVGEHASSFLGLVCEADRQQVELAVRAHLDDDQQLDVECRFGTGATAERWFQVRGAAVRAADGRPERIIGSIRDVTAKKLTEQLKDEFISTVSHELRTPLTSARGALGLLAGGVAGEVPSSAGEMIEIARRNTERLTSLVNDLLDVQRFEGGGVDLELEELDPREVMREAVDAARGLEAIHEVHLELEAPDAAPPLRGDRKRLLQVLANLFSNAAKFSRARETVVGRVTVLDDTIRFSVEDSGPGIPEDFQSQVFDKFSQADSTSVRRHPGSGLGLAISKALVEAHGGTIGFDSTVGEGTTFYVDLAVADRSRRAAGGP